MLGPMASSPPIRVVIADDQELVRRSLQALLDGEDGIEVVATAGDGHAAVLATLRTNAQIVLLDVDMPVKDGIAALAELRAKAPTARALMLTMHDEASYVRRAFDEGAYGFVSKEASGDELLSAIRAVASGRRYLEPRVGAEIAVAPSGDEPPLPLSERELEILRLIALGHTNAEIAKSLYLSVRTVESHRKSVQDKLGVQTRAELVRLALDAGLVDAADA